MSSNVFCLMCLVILLCICHTKTVVTQALATVFIVFAGGARHHVISMPLGYISGQNMKLKQINLLEKI